MSTKKKMKGEGGPDHSEEDLEQPFIETGKAPKDSHNKGKGKF
jgi:hypothetical protein